MPTNCQAGLVIPAPVAEATLGPVGTLAYHNPAVHVLRTG